MGEPSIHPYALTQYWRQNPKARSLSYSTLYRCLDALEERGFVTSSRTEGASGGPTRRRYELTKAGSALAFQLQDMTDDRLGAPKPL